MSCVIYHRNEDTLIKLPVNPANEFHHKPEFYSWVFDAMMVMAVPSNLKCLFQLCCQSITSTIESLMFNSKILNKGSFQASIWDEERGLSFKKREFKFDLKAIGKIWWWRPTVTSNRWRSRHAQQYSAVGTSLVILPWWVVGQVERTVKVVQLMS